MFLLTQDRHNMHKNQNAMDHGYDLLSELDHEGVPDFGGYLKF